MTDPLLGRHPAPANQLGGRGLFLVHALADLVRVHTSEQGTTIRVYHSSPALCSCRRTAVRPVAPVAVPQTSFRTRNASSRRCLSWPDKDICAE
ncbi:hypothetical protein [Amycolatopsis sp. MEPSY49]|uniref:hypothetical protein n=1 Tax=Amycolatopsis sp. MEPSY49 TaxID=3151600 RepID=UPI003F50F943